MGHEQRRIVANYWVEIAQLSFLLPEMCFQLGQLSINTCSQKDLAHRHKCMKNMQILMIAHRRRPMTCVTEVLFSLNTKTRGGSITQNEKSGTKSTECREYDRQRTRMGTKIAREELAYRNSERECNRNNMQMAKKTAHRHTCSEQERVTKSMQMARKDAA